MCKKATLTTLALLLAVFALGDGILFADHAQADWIESAATTPELTIPSGILAAGNSVVRVPIHFAHNNRGVAAAAFSIKFDTNCLELDLQDGALKPGTVQFNLPPQFSGSAYYESSVPGGRIDIVFGDFATPLSTLPDTQSIVSIEFLTTCLPPTGTSIVAPVTFSDTPAFSYSDTLGHPISGHVIDGSVTIKRNLPPATATPTPTPGPAPNVNSAPIAKDDNATTRLPDQVTIHVLANDIEPDGDTMSIFSVTQGGLGQVVANSDGSITYTPTAQHSGNDRFTYTVSDGKGGLAAAAVWVTVEPANRPPEATDDNAVTDEDVSVTISVLQNDTDPDADDSLLFVAILGSPSHGTVRLNANGKVVYTPDLNYNGVDSFMYAVSDREGGSDIAVVTVTIRPVDDPPITMIDSVDLIDFMVHETSGKLEVYWRTRSEYNAAGYYIYRTQSGQIQTGLMTMPYIGAWKRISPRIAGQGSAGGVYRYIDETAKPGVLYAYTLVAIDPEDNISLFGPHSAAGPVEQNPTGDLLLPLVYSN